MAYQDNYSALWAAIDELARQQGWSTSKLAIRAGLDPTALNKSKRRKGGEDRWIGLETLFKILDAADVSLSDFDTLMTDLKSAAPWRRMTYQRHNERTLFARSADGHEMAYAFQPGQNQSVFSAKLQALTPVELRQTFDEKAGFMRVTELSRATSDTILDLVSMDKDLDQHGHIVVRALRFNPGRTENPEVRLLVRPQDSLPVRTVFSDKSGPTVRIKWPAIAEIRPDIFKLAPSAQELRIF